jgi:hypothetical protein
VHISETSVDNFDTFVLFNKLAEGTVAQLHIRKLILVLNKEFTRIFAHLDRHVWHDVLEIPFGQVSVKVGQIPRVDFLVAHLTQHEFVNFDWFVVFGGLLVEQV